MLYGTAAACTRASTRWGMPGSQTTAPDAYLYTHWLLISMDAASMQAVYSTNCMARTCKNTAVFDMYRGRCCPLAIASGFLYALV